MAKLIVAVRNFANALKILKYIFILIYVIASVTVLFLLTTM
jgi:hypothetical protein